MIQEIREMGYVVEWGASTVKLGDFGYKQNSFLAQQTVQDRAGQDTVSEPRRPLA